jgi:purine-binding chemotaxis protein CheW
MDSLEMGILVDKVSEVLQVSSENIDHVPDFGAGTDTNFILGIEKSRGKARILLDIKKVLSTDDVAEVHLSTGEVA